MDEKKYPPSSNDLADFFLGSKDSESENNPDPEEGKDFSALPIKRKNLRQPKDPSGKFHRTLPGFLIHYIECSGPTKEDDLIQVLSENLHKLRNSSGAVYRNSTAKCLAGVCGMPIFTISGHIWDLVPQEVRAYRDTFISKIKKPHRGNKIEKKGLRNTEKIVGVLRKYSLQMSKDSRTSSLLTDPLKELTGTEDIQEAATKVGYERLIGILQSYYVVSKHYMYLISKEKNSVQLTNLEKDINGIYSKLSRIESHLSLSAHGSRSEQ